MNNNDPNYYCFDDTDDQFLRFVGNKCYHKVSKTRESDVSHVDHFFSIERFRGVRISKDEYWAGTPGHSSAISDEARTDRALRLMEEAHAGQKDKAGGPEILHPLRVGLMGKDEDEMIVGFLHDAAEDGGATHDDFEIAWLSGRQIGALHFLTHSSGTYDEYIDTLIASGNDLALSVKLNDLEDNIKRGIEGGFTETVEKHKRARQKVIEALKIAHK